MNGICKNRDKDSIACKGCCHSKLHHTRSGYCMRELSEDKLTRWCGKERAWIDPVCVQAKLRLRVFIPWVDGDSQGARSMFLDLTPEQERSLLLNTDEHYAEVAIETIEL